MRGPFPESSPLREEQQRLQAEIARLQLESELLRRVLSSRSWRWTRPLRFFARLTRHGLDAEDGYRLRMWLRRFLRGVPGAGARVAAGPLPGPVSTSRPVQDLLSSEDVAALRVLPAPKGSKPDVYLWAVIDWHFRVQRPQHLARALAENGHRVFYISNNFVDNPTPGFSIEPLDKDHRLYQVHLHLAGAPTIYAQIPTSEQSVQLARGLVLFAQWHGGNDAVSIVQHPYWTAFAGRWPATRVLYDCMDHHAGFANNTAGIVAEERRLVACSDLVVVTSQWLAQEIGRDNVPVALIRNATEFSHFNEPPPKVFADRAGRKVMGYYGAIADWFDLDLVRAVAERFPEHLVLLIGGDTAGASVSLADLDNVHCTGEVKYSELPYWLHGFDVCLLPFKVEPLTLATNPVKVYEYLSAGKPVVSVDLPEMVQFGNLVRVASTREAFGDAVADVLATPESPALVAARKAFAAQQTWAHRAEALDQALAAVRPPRVSVVVVTYNNLSYTRDCLDSLDRFSDWPELEIIVVDNASHDGTPEFLEQWAGEGASRQVILNPDNRGFAAANNQGLAQATGDYLVLLNNDTYVTRGWIRALIAHLRRDPGIGMVGPVTNNIGNEARIESAYRDMAGMAEFAADYTTRHAGRAFDIKNLAFFCVAMPRSTYQHIGPLDEAFGIGFFEDDDYCRRVQQAGLRCVCAEDVFIHHQLSASFDALKADQRQALFERNRRIYEAKWGPWQPHSYRG